MLSLSFDYVLCWLLKVRADYGISSSDEAIRQNDPPQGYRLDWLLHHLTWASVNALSHSA